MAEVPEDDALPNLTLTPIGVVRSPFRVHLDAPRQPRTRDEAARGRIELRTGMQNLLKDLAGFSHVWVVYWFHVARGWNETVRPPRDRQHRGVLATRAPHRPNPIGLSLVRLRRVHGTTLEIEDLDMLDGSPVLDIKPYLPYADRVDDAVAGWVDELGPDAGPDHVDWRTDKGHPQEP